MKKKRKAGKSSIWKPKAKTIYRKKTQLINQSTNYQHTSTIQPSDTKATSRVSWHLANHLPWFARTPPWQRGAWKSTRSGYPSWPCAKKSVCHIQAHVTPTVGWLQRLQHVTTFQFWCPKKQMDQKMIRFYGLQAYSLGNLLLLIEELICSKPPLAHPKSSKQFHLHQRLLVGHINPVIYGDPLSAHAWSPVRWSICIPGQLIDTLVVTNLILVGEIELGKTLDLTVAIG